jgi:Uma2 family endonuclease
MPATLSYSLTDEIPVRERHKRWTREECAWLVEMGKLRGGSFELLEGNIVYKMGKKRRHVQANHFIAKWARRHFGEDYVQTQDPIALNEQNEPEPDVCVLRKTTAEYDDTPDASEVLLVIEVGDTTVREDTTLKAVLYARAGIAEYWVVDVNGGRLMVFREPDETGYKSLVSYVSGESVAPLAKTEALLNVADILS